MLLHQFMAEILHRNKIFSAVQIAQKNTFTVALVKIIDETRVTIQQVTIELRAEIKNNEQYVYKQKILKKTVIKHRIQFEQITQYQ